MTRLEKIGLVLVVIGVVWMIGKAIYGIGYRAGEIDATQKTSDELLVACEQKIDMMDDACYEAIQQAKIDAQNEILEQF